MGHVCTARAVDRWREQLINIYERGAQAKRDGIPRCQCPYKYASGVQRQRQTYWLMGWNRTDA